MTRVDRLNLNANLITSTVSKNDGTTIGHGFIAAAGLINNESLTASGGTLQMHTTFPPDPRHGARPPKARPFTTAATCQPPSSPAG